MPPEVFKPFPGRLEIVRRLRVFIDRGSKRVERISSDALVDYRQSVPVDAVMMSDCLELCEHLSEARKCLAALTMPGVNQ